MEVNTRAIKSSWLRSQFWAELTPFNSFTWLDSASKAPCNKLFVYECMVNGCLDAWIFCKTPKYTLECNDTYIREINSGWSISNTSWESCSTLTRKSIFNGKCVFYKYMEISSRFHKYMDSLVELGTLNKRMMCKYM